MTVNVSGVILYVLREMRQERGDNVDMRKLKGKMKEQGMSVYEVAKLIGIGGSTLYYRLRCPTKITIGEALRLKDVLKLTDKEALDIFLI